MRIKLLGLLASSLFTAALFAQGAVPDLIVDAPAGKALPRVSQSVNAAFPPGVTPVRSRPIQLNLAAIDPDAPGARGQGRRRVRLNLFPGVDLEVQETRARGLGRPGRFHWSGKPTNGASSDVVLSVVDGRVSGSLSLAQGFFQIRHVEGDLHEVTELTVSRGQTTDDAVVPTLPTVPAPAAKAIAAPTTAAMAATPKLDVLVVYTPEARARLGGSQNIQDRILLSVAEANTSFLNSTADLELNLIGMAEIPVTNPQSATGGFLNQVTFSEPAIQSLREHYGADLVSVWIDGAASGFIGIGWLNPGPPSNFSTHAYTVVHATAAAGPSYTFTHEEGHNLGGAHDRANAANQGAFAYSYGYRHNPPGGSGFYTLMAYSSGCSGCSPVNNWSNPNVLIDGTPSGIAQGQPNSADNASTITQIAPLAELYRTAQNPAPNNPPTANDQTLTVTSSSPAPITLTGNDPDGNPVFFDVLTQPLHGSLTGAGANLSYTGDFGYSGPDSIGFQIRDGFGGFDEGAITLNVQLPTSNPPTVSLAQPAGGPFTAPASITLVATATDSDGSIDHVDFFANGQQVGTATSATSTFSFVWTNVLDGPYQLTAVAKDNLGITATSSPVSLTVNPGGGGASYTTRMSRLFYAFDEGSGATVADKIGTDDGTVGGAASWTSLGLQGGWVDSSANGFVGNNLSAASGDAYTILWVGRLDTGNAYQTLFSMSDPSAANVQVRYYQPSGSMFLHLNNNISGFMSVTPLFGKVVMVAVRCSAGSCAWRVGGSGPWLNASPGTVAAANPSLTVGADFPHWQPHVNNTSALFWVYGDALTDSEVDVNFQFAGATLNTRASVTLDGYVPGTSNLPPSVSLATPQGGPFTAPASINLVATAGDSDGSVARVDFLADGSPIGSATSASSTFSLNWTGVAAGTYSLVARAVDNLGASTDSSPVSVTVDPSGGGGGGGYTTRAAELYYAFDEGAGATVLDKVGTNHGTTGGAASWTSLGLQGGWVDSAASGLVGNNLSAASGDAYTILWVGRLDTGNAYQTLFAMSDPSGINVQIRYYQPSGSMFLHLNNKISGFMSVPSLFGKVVMVAVRCSAGTCAWRVGGTGSWLNSTPGVGVASNPSLTVGADHPRWQPHVNNTSALFWIYSDSLSDPEIDATFQFAGSTLNARGGFLLDGYTAGPSNIPPTVSLLQPAGGPFTAPASINLVATAGDSDGSIDRVEFLADGALIGTDTTGTPSYTFSWSGVAAGTYSVFARAFDNSGASTDSSPVSITVDSSGGGGPSYTTRAGLLYYAFDENGGPTVYDQIGANNAAVGGAASWTTLGLQGGYADSGFSPFPGNQLSAASGDAFTTMWVGRLDTSSSYQTLFSMGDAGAANIQLRYYQPNGSLYLMLNGAFGGFANVSALVGKIVMITTRCSGGSCAWRIGSGPWMNASPGSAAATAPKLQVGSDFNHWAPNFNTASALFWVYSDSLTDPEIDANFQFAGATLNTRAGVTLDGYVP